FHEALPPLNAIWSCLNVARVIAAGEAALYLWVSPPPATHPDAGSPTITSSPPMNAELYTAIVAPAMRGSPGFPGRAGVMWKGSAGSFVSDLKVTLRRLGS